MDQCLEKFENPNNLLVAWIDDKKDYFSLRSKQGTKFPANHMIMDSSENEENKQYVKPVY